ncbi:isoprenyl transferase [bacterium]|nr:isoprenyl transferase [bacterium]
MDKNPRHIAIIMDGNGRWAQRRGLPRLEGHLAGVGAVRRIVEACRDLGIPYLTLYTFSTENWRRPKEEVEGLMMLLREQLRSQTPELKEKGVRVIVIGKRDELPLDLQAEIKRSEEETAQNKDLHLILAINYGGRAEIVQACKRIIEKVKSGEIEDIDEASFSSYLYTRDIPDPDLLIRTAGEQRISNFLLWQIAYTEFYITDTLWPDFTKEDLIKAIEDYKRRKRKFGGLADEESSNIR